MIMPSIIANNQEEFNKRVAKVSFADALHIDVMDGHFTPSTSMDFPLEMKKPTYCEFHLMCVDPLAHLDKYMKYADRFILQAEANHLDEAIAKIKQHNKKVGMAFNPETPIHKHEEVDQITVMTVHPGYYGARFLPEMLPKISEAAKIATVEVDGSMNIHTISHAKKAGAQKFVVGSALQKATDAKKTYEELTKNSEHTSS